MCTDVLNVEALVMSNFYCINFLITLSVNTSSIIMIIIFHVVLNLLWGISVVSINRDVMSYNSDYLWLIHRFGLSPKLREIMSNFS